MSRPSIAMLLAALVCMVAPAGWASTRETFAYDRGHPAGGFWVGTITTGQRPAFVTVTIDRGDDGGWVATATALVLLAIDRPCDDLRIDGNEVSFTLRAGGAELRFEGQVSGDGQRLAGSTVSAVGANGTFQLHRTIAASATAAPIALKGKIRLPSQTLDLSMVFGATPGGNPYASMLLGFNVDLDRWLGSFGELGLCLSLGPCR